MLAVRKKASLEDWLREALNCEDYEKKCSHIVLQIMSAGGAETELRTCKIGGGRNWGEAELAKFFQNYAQTYCQDLPGTHTFRLVAFYGDNTPRLMHPFMLAGQLDNNGMGTEQPTNEGMRMQGMRHQEALIQGLFGERAVVMDAAFRLIRAQQEMIAVSSGQARDLMQENIDAVTLVKRIALEDAQKKAEHALSVRKFERESEDRRMMFKALPLLINTITGKEIIPQGASDTLLIEAIAENLKEDQIQMLVSSGMLPESVAGMVFTRFKQVLEEKRRLHEEALSRGSEADIDADDDPVTTVTTEGEIPNAH